MKLDICFLFFVGCLIQLSVGGNKGNSAKTTNYPSTVKSEEETKSVKTTSPEKKEPVKKSHSKKPEEKEEIVVHNHGDRDYYESKASQYKPVDNYDFDKEYNDDTFDKYLKYFQANLENPEEDGYKTSTSVHTEHFEIKELNPKASTPEERYIIRGGYKVQESDPFDSKSKKTHLHTYDSPLSKIAASIYSKFDYLNFPNNSNDDDEEEEPKENKEAEEGEASEKREEKEEDNSNDNDNDDYYGKVFGKYEEDDEYNAAEDDEDDEEDEKKEEEKKESDDYSTQPSTEQKKDEDKEESESFDDFSYPAFPTDIDTIYSDDWKKYILELVYGDFEEDYYSPSNIYEVRVRAKRKV